MFEGPCKDTDHSEVIAEGGRQVFDNLRQPSVSGDMTSRLEASYDLAKRMDHIEKEISNRRVWFESVDTRLQFLESSCKALPGVFTQTELQEKEEHKKLKDKIKMLEARNKELLSKAMDMHKHSENMNDPWRLTAVLQMYELLRLQNWEKFRSSTAPYLSYRIGSSIIKKLFDACEKDIQQRTASMFKVLEIPPLNEAMTNTEQRVMQDIRNIFKYSYSQNHPEFYSQIVMDPPVKAVWNLQESSTQCLEHVDKKDREHWRKSALLWPIMKCGEEVIVKGVVWDEK